jgi:hypothetical protein
VTAYAIVHQDLVAQLGHNHIPFQGRGIGLG